MTNNDNSCTSVDRECFLFKEDCTEALSNNDPAYFYASTGFNFSIFGYYLLVEQYIQYLLDSTVQTANICLKCNMGNLVDTTIVDVVTASITINVYCPSYYGSGLTYNVFDYYMTNYDLTHQISDSSSTFEISLQTLFSNWLNIIII
jgi:hypothetical protein